MTALSYQLYSPRAFAPLVDTLAMLKRLGYAEVEGYGGLYGDPASLKSALDDSGLAMTSGHFDLDMLEEDPQKVLEIAGILGMKAVYCPYLAPEQRPVDKSGWRAFGARLQQAGAPLREADLIFGWHNHDYEFVPFADGTLPLDALFDGGADLSWEVDIAWIVRAGADPLNWIERHGARIDAVHIKDIAPDGQCVDEDGWADVGHGTLDWPMIWNRILRDTSARHFVMEHDNPGDHERFARRSLEALAIFGNA